ncbi:MAG: hypothetical protein AB1782_20820 [Cyanobacteriota bacterium]
MINKRDKSFNFGSNKKINGSALSQYGIIIALIALILIPGFFLVGKNIFNSFFDFYNKLGEKEYNNSSSTSTSTSSTSSTFVPPTIDVVPGSLGGSPDKPSKECVNGICTIDYGDFVLSGIPNDLESHLQSSGASGTTEDIITLLDQIIAQQNNIDTNADFSVLKKISNYGHGIAETEKKLEENAQKYLNDPSAMISNEFLQPALQLKSDQDRASLEIWLQSLNMNLKGSSNPNDQNVLSIVNALSGQIIKLADKMSVFGTDAGTGLGVTTENVQKILEPQASLTTDLNSAIICNTGKHVDTGTYCN